MAESNSLNPTTLSLPLIIALWLRLARILSAGDGLILTLGVVARYIKISS